MMLCILTNILESLELKLRLVSKLCQTSAFLRRFFKIPLMFVNLFWDWTRYYTQLFFITIQILDSVNASIKFDVRIVILLIDYILVSKEFITVLIPSFFR